MTGDQEQPEGPGADPTTTEPTITAGYTARWTDTSGPNPGERKKSVIRECHIEPACEDSTGFNTAGFSITLTESFVPGAAARYFVRWRDDDQDETETFTNRAEALTAYERRIRDFRACADVLDERSPTRDAATRPPPDP